MIARGPLAGLALAALGASGAAAEDDGLASILEGCVGNVVTSLEAIRAEFPDFVPNQFELMLFGARQNHADLEGFVARQIDRSRMEVVSGVCVAADLGAFMLEILRRGDRSEVEVLRQAVMERILGDLEASQ